VLVAVPIEMPDGVSYEGVFGELDEKEALGEVAAGGTIAFPWQQGRQEGTELGRPAGAPGFGSLKRLHANAAPAPPPSAGPKDKGIGPNTGRPIARGASPPATDARAPRGAKRDAPGKGRGGSFGGGGSPDRSAGKSPSVPGARGMPAPADAPVTAGEAVRKSAAPAEPEAERLGLELRDSVTFADSDRYRAANQVTADELKQVFKRSNANEPAPTEVTQARLDVADDLEEAWAVPQLAQIPVVEEFFKMRELQAPVVGGRPIYAQHVALVIGARVDEGRIDAARSLAEALAQARPDYETGVKMRNALADDSLDQNEIQGRIAALAERAAQELAAARTEARRRARLNRVLDPALRAMVEGRPLVTVLVTKPTTRQRWHFRRPASRSRPRRSPCRSSWARWTQQTWRPSPCSMRFGGSRRRVWRWRGTSPGARWRVQR
jgi:hypothetical protein